MIEIERPPITEKAILARLALPGDSEDEIEESLHELGQLVWTAGAEVVATFVQHRPQPAPGTLIGEGKIAEVKAAVEELDADLVVFDSDLTPNQGANLEDQIGVKVVDRTQLILDIFAQHAHTREGRLQVELAQLQYILPRLTGRGSVMRQQGGIGIRGPGEQKLELDRRRIRERMQRIREDLEKVKLHRRVQRKNRTESTSGTVALVGYTNAGKSSLLNALTGADVLVENKLFATLDPRVRRCELPSGREILLADTVGFVRKLPHMLVAAFRATLEEVMEADLVLHVIDASHPHYADQVEAVHRVLEEIGMEDVPSLKVYNKADQLSAEQRRGLIGTGEPAVLVSAKTGEGLDGLLELVERHLATTRRRVQLRIPQSEAGLVSRLHQRGRVFSESYEGNDIVLDAELEQQDLATFKEYLA
ncbi:MAG: GTPase HflX [Candidatus Hydrogenedentes bacterium]|nr:GTPase HflX [Candidatus Hydrogenedentota bacterium]